MRHTEEDLDRLRHLSETAFRLAQSGEHARQFSTVELVELRDEVIAAELAKCGFDVAWEPTS